MHNRRALIISMLAAVVLWVLLVLVTNYVQPDSFGQALLLLLWALAVLTTSTPVYHYLNARWGRPLGPRGDLTRAFRQGMFTAILALLLLALRLLRTLTPLIAVILVLITVLLELLFYVRRR